MSKTLAARDSHASWNPQKFPMHERCRQAPQNKQEEQNQDSAAVARAMNDFLRAVRATGHHEESGRNERPKRQFCNFLFGGKDGAGTELHGNRYRTQFLLSSS